MAAATLSGRRDAGGGLVLVALDVDRESADGYTTPGQYVEVTAPGASGFFVLAGEPTAGSAAHTWELLVRNAGDAADLLVTRPLGSTVEVTHPIGTGLPGPLAEEAPVIVAVVGSALGLARPVMRLRVGAGHASSTELFIGLRAAVDLPLRDEVSAWADAGVRIVLCLSRAELEHHLDVVPRAERAAGYVQHAVARLGRSPIRIIAAGPDAMLAELRALSGADVVTNRG
ncbi:MAG: hypothetical protein KF819_03180 [Labilithrix sp.]|nr:hypothetical protein [Labilithrix sp.]